MLIVDDEPLVGQALARILGRTADVVVARGGRDALAQLAGGQRFDLIVCDVVMPDVDGLGLYEAVRREQPAVVERFVFMTGGILSGETRRRMAALPNKVLEKPFGLAELVELVAATR